MEMKEPLRLLFVEDVPSEVEIALGSSLKIDRSFVAGLPDSSGAVALVSTVIALARAFSLTTVAEGVETAEQLQALRELGCQQSQGYLHGRPRAASRITALLDPSRSGTESGLHQAGSKIAHFDQR